jgi:hypothetical protein
MPHKLLNCEVMKMQYMQLFLILKGMFSSLLELTELFAFGLLKL